jgi:hypothetical protein
MKALLRQTVILTLIALAPSHSWGLNENILTTISVPG